MGKRTSPRATTFSGASSRIMQSDAASKRSAISARSLDLARIAIAHPGTRPAHTRHGPLEHHRSLPGPPVDARPDHTITLRVTASGAASRAVRDYCKITAFLHGCVATQHRNYDNTSARGSTERLCEADSVRKVKRCVADHCNTRNVMPDPIPRRPQRRAGAARRARATPWRGRNANGHPHADAAHMRHGTSSLRNRTSEGAPTQSDTSPTSPFVLPRG